MYCCMLCSNMGNAHLGNMGYFFFCRNVSVLFELRLSVVKIGVMGLGNFVKFVVLWYDTPFLSLVVPFF